MATEAVEIDSSELTDFFNKLDVAGKGEFKKELMKFVDGIGNEFLRIVEDEIIRCNAMDTRLLLNSFHKGAEENVWIISDDGLQLEVGTNVEYASYVNDGHWTNKKGQAMRWVPGVWSGDRFIYTPGAKTGMLLKQKWVEGKHYFDSAVRIIEKMIPEYMEKQLNQWIKSYFGL